MCVCVWGRQNGSELCVCGGGGREKLALLGGPLSDLAPVKHCSGFFILVNAGDLRHRPGSVNYLWFMGVQEVNWL